MVREDEPGPSISDATNDVRLERIDTPITNGTAAATIDTPGETEREEFVDGHVEHMGDNLDQDGSRDE